MKNNNLMDMKKKKKKNHSLSYEEQQFNGYEKAREKNSFVIL